MFTDQVHLLKKRRLFVGLLGSLGLTMVTLITCVLYPTQSSGAPLLQETTTPVGMYLPVVFRPDDTPTNTPTPTGTPTNTPTSTPTVKPGDPFSIDGVWVGRTGQSRAITFTIASRAFTRFTTSYRVGGCGAIQTTFYRTPEPIEGNTFVVIQSGTGQVTTVTDGTFSVDHCASGSMAVTGTQCGSLTTTWTAIKQGGDGSTCPFTPTPTPGSNDTGRVVFASGRDGNSEIYVMSANGSAPTRLTNNSAIDSAPRWSPDGAKIVFHSNRDSNYEIYVMNADGSDQTRLTTNANDDVYPAWSPDGQQIAFSAAPTSGVAQIWTMQADGSGQQMLTPRGNTSIESDWSHNGTRIVYRRATGQSWDIHTINADGTNETNLSNTNFIDEADPIWSPDGSGIVFEANPSGFFSQIYVMSADGPGVQQLTTGDANFDPTWSPDGKRILFASNRDGNSELYVMNADGSDQTRLTDNTTSDFDPDWAP